MSVAGEVTDPSRVSDERLQVGEVDLYIARPTTPGPHPSVVVIEEAFGRVEHIEDICRRFANIGYVAASPELYCRTGVPELEMEKVLPAMFGLPDSQIIADCEAVAEHLRSLDETTDKIGIIGFCMGGRITSLVTFSSRSFDAGVACWGGFIETATFDDATTTSRPTPVVELAEGLSCPILIVGGGDDDNPSPDQLRSMHERLVAAGKDSSINIYEGAGHAFFADYRPGYSEAQAFELWADATTFLSGHLT